MSALATVQLAHDLRLMLRVMARCTESLRARFAPARAADADFIELEGAIDNAFYISRELASLGRPRTIGPAVVDVNELVAQAQGVIERMLGPSISLVLQLEAIDPIVEAEAVQLEWVLLNVAANCRDAMPSGGVVTIVTASVVPRDAISPHVLQHLRISITDTGVGVSDEIRARMTEPFFTTRPNASGMGLTSVEMIVRGLRGWLRIDRAERGGTSLHIHLPVLTRTMR